MSERITDANRATEVQTRLNTLRGEADMNSRALATGLKIHKPSDDPEVLGRGLALKANELLLEQYQNNADRAARITGVTARSLDDMSQDIVRAQEVAGLTNNELTVAQYGAYKEEVNGLLESMFTKSNETYLGKPLFAGTNTGVTPFTVVRDGGGKITSISYVGNSNTAEAAISPTVNIDPHADGVTNNNLLSAMNAVMALRDALEANDSAAVAAVQSGSLLVSSDNMSEAVAKIGSKMFRIDVAKSRNASDITVGRDSIGDEISAKYEESLIKIQQAMSAYEVATKIYSGILGELGLIKHI